MRNVSGFLHRHDENGRQSQAVCPFWALGSRKLGNVSGYLHCFMKLADSFRLFAFFCTPPPKIGERLRLFAFFDTPMMKLADSLRLCALHSRQMRNVSGFLHRHDENGRPSQAVCLFGALHSRKLGNVSGYLHLLMKLADSLWRFALFWHPTPENWGTFQAICLFDTPMMTMADCIRLYALHSRKLRNVSGFLHCHDENGRQSQAFCIFRAFHSRKLGNVSGCLHFL